MKDIFRSAGEGTFTEGDQKILTNLIPTRSDTKETIVEKLRMIDSIVMQKLAPTGGSSAGQPAVKESAQDAVGNVSEMSDEDLFN
jgi:hypothetical protein